MRGGRNNERSFPESGKKFGRLPPWMVVTIPESHPSRKRLRVFSYSQCDEFFWVPLARSWSRYFDLLIFQFLHPVRDVRIRHRHDRYRRPFENLSPCESLREFWTRGETRLVARARPVPEVWHSAKQAGSKLALGSRNSRHNSETRCTIHAYRTRQRSSTRLPATYAVQLNCLIIIVWNE